MQRNDRRPTPGWAVGSWKGNFQPPGSINLVSTELVEGGQPQQGLQGTAVCGLNAPPASFNAAREPPGEEGDFWFSRALNKSHSASSSFGSALSSTWSHQGGSRLAVEAEAACSKQGGVTEDWHWCAPESDARVNSRALSLGCGGESSAHTCGASAVRTLVRAHSCNYNMPGAILFM